MSDLGMQTLTTLYFYAKDWFFHDKDWYFYDKAWYFYDKDWYFYDTDWNFHNKRVIHVSSGKAEFTAVVRGTVRP